MNKINNILVATNHLKNLGGSETFTYTLIKSLKQKNLNIEYFCFEKGLVSSKIENELSVNFLSKKNYDVVFANHNTTINFLKKRISSIFIQTCHGIYPPLEQPHKYADGYISISDEVKSHLKKLGYDSTVILNGIDCNRFNSSPPPNPKLKSVLSLCQSIEANSTIKEACDSLGVDFNYFDKNINPVWDIEKMINENDLVIGLGRSAFEAMACARPVIIYDNRSYSSSYGDGYLTQEKLKNSIKKNCSGRYYKLNYTSEDLIKELKKYKIEDGIYLRNYALVNLNIDIQSNLYLDIAKKTKKNHIKDFRFKFKILKSKLKFYR